MEATSAAASRPTAAQGIRRLTAAQAISSLGDGSFHVTSALFLSHVVGLSAAQTGLWLSIAWATGFALSTTLGHLADRMGLRRGAVGLSLGVACALVAATQVRDQVGFLAVITAYAVAQSGLGAVRQAIVATEVAPAERVSARARLHVAINSGLGLGAALGGAALAVGSTSAYLAVFWFDACCFLVSVVLLGRMPVSRGPRPVRAATGALRGGVLRDAPYVAAAGLAAVLYLYMPILTVVLPLFLVRATSAPSWAVAMVFIVNTVGVVLLQVRAARPVSSTAAAVTASRRGALALGAACLVFAAASLTDSPSVALLVVGMGAVVQVSGEVLVAAGTWHLGFALADPDRPGQWQGLFASGLPLARSLGPVLMTALVLGWSGPGWLVVALVLAGAGAALGPVAAWGERRRPPPPCEPLTARPLAA